MAPIQPQTRHGESQATEVFPRPVAHIYIYIYIYIYTRIFGRTSCGLDSIWINNQKLVGNGNDGKLIGNDRVWVYVVSESLGICCMAMFAAFPSTIMEAAFGRLHNNGARTSGARPIVVESIMAKPYNLSPTIHLQHIPTPSSGCRQTFLVCSKYDVGN